MVTESYPGEFAQLIAWLLDIRAEFRAKASTEPVRYLARRHALASRYAERLRHVMAHSRDAREAMDEIAERFEAVLANYGHTRLSAPHIRGMVPCTTSGEACVAGPALVCAWL